MESYTARFVLQYRHSTGRTIPYHRLVRPTRLEISTIPRYTCIHLVLPESPTPLGPTTDMRHFLHRLSFGIMCVGRPTISILTVPLSLAEA